MRINLFFLISLVYILQSCGGHKTADHTEENKADTTLTSIETIPKDTPNIAAKILECKTCTFQSLETHRSAREVQLTLNRTDLPPEYIKFLTTSESMDIDGPTEVIHFLSVKDAKEFNSDIKYRTEIPFMYYFGDDRGDNWYAFDLKNSWGKGRNAIFMIPMGALWKPDSRYIAANLAEFIEALGRDTSFHSQSYPTMRASE